MRKATVVLAIITILFTSSCDNNCIIADLDADKTEDVKLYDDHFVSIDDANKFL